LQRDTRGCACWSCTKVGAELSFVIAWLMLATPSPAGAATMPENQEKAPTTSPEKEPSVGGPAQAEAVSASLTAAEKAGNAPGEANYLTSRTWHFVLLSRKLCCVVLSIWKGSGGCRGRFRAGGMMALKLQRSQAGRRQMLDVLMAGSLSYVSGFGGCTSIGLRQGSGEWDCLCCRSRRRLARSAHRSFLAQLVRSM
jgi:hypothetical protein